MSHYYYIDANGQKQGLITEQQLQALAAQGVITPTTPLETDTGQQSTAGQIADLKFNTVPLAPFLINIPAYLCIIAMTAAFGCFPFAIVGISFYMNGRLDLTAGRDRAAKKKIGIAYVLWGLSIGCGIYYLVLLLSRVPPIAISP